MAGSTPLPGGSREVFVYWKLPEDQAAAAIAASLQMQAELATALPGLRCRLHRRADIRQGLVTLMETYSHATGVTAAHETQIAAACVRHLAAWADAPRHLEVFEALDG